MLMEPLCCGAVWGPMSITNLICSFFQRKSAPVERKFLLGLDDQLYPDISPKEIVYDDIVDSLADLVSSSRIDEDDMKRWRLNICPVWKAVKARAQSSQQ
jgi:hypothetical protein